MTNQHRPCRRPEKVSRRAIFPPDMADLADQFVRMASAVETERYADADEDGDLQVEEKPRTQCSLEIE